MHRRSVFLLILVLAIASLSSAQSSPLAAGTGVPPVIRFSGTLAVAPGRVPVTFGLYQEEVGGEPLWTETRPVVVEPGGRFSVVLGARAPLPAELFTSGEARWLDVAVEGLPPQPRRLLVSVPYALKAADAETIGGKPLSAFVLAGDNTGVGADGLTYVDRRVLAAGIARAGTGATGGAGTPGYLGVFTDPTTLGDSVIYQSGTSVGINTAAPAAAFHSVAAAAPGTFFDVYSNALGALPVVYRAARGTPAAPTAVQTNDILGGLAVRGYGTTGFTTGRGQVMFKAAENWTDTANGTYLQFTTTPVGTGAWAERMRIAPDGNVGIGIQAPAQKLSVAGTIESTTGGFKFPDGTTQTTALSLGTNAFTATQTITSGNLALPATTGSGSGVLMLGGQSFMHGYGATTYPNTFLGPQAGSFSISGSGGNVGVGALALAANTTGAYNTAVGLWALTSNTTGGSNIAVGQGALYRNSTASMNTAVGYASLGFATTSGYNAAVGAYALAKATGQFNSALGYGALANSIAVDGNSAFGAYSLNQNTTASGNSAFGYQALTANTTAIGNSAFGYQSLAGTTASYNSAFGYRALAADTTGQSNSAFGYQSSASPMTGWANSSFGVNSLYSTVGGGYNNAFGYTSLYSNVGGANNAAFGAGALYGVTAGSNNTGVGSSSGGNVTTGSNNTFVGYLAGTDAAHGALTNATAVGANSLVTQNNSLVLGGIGANAVSVGIGTSAPLKTLQVVGDIRVGTSGANGCLENFAGTGLVGTCSSDLRLKTNVQPFAPVLGKVAQLQPVHFTWRAGEFPNRHYGNAVNSGLVAQQVEQVFPELVSTDAAGYKMVNYSELPYLTLQAVKELKTKSDRLEAENDALRARVDTKDEQLRQLAEQLAALTRAVAALGDRRR